MFVQTPRALRRKSWLFTVIAAVAFAAQLVVALVPLAEGRFGRTMSAHVESGSTKGHYAHNEATCAACQARSIHGTTSRTVAPIPETTLAMATAFAPVDRIAAASVHPQANPRAPPAVI
jgi:hypothetical protein